MRYTNAQNSVLLALLALLAWLLMPVLASAATSEDDLLDPEVAFTLAVTAQDADTVVATWTIAPGYYLYRERLAFQSNTPGLALGEPQLPKGKVKEDEFFGKQEIYRDSVSAVVPVLARETGAARDLELQATSQGCADLGICYPPQTQTMTVALVGAAQAAEPPPPAVPRPAIAPAPAGPVSEQDMIATMLTEQRFLSMPAFFGFGLLLAFTPCVFPMIPILSSLIVGQGQITQRQSFILSVVYVLAMAVTYTVAGVLAALLGANVQALFQNPWVLVTFSLLFAALAMSMFGFYDLQIPTSWQSKLSELSNRHGGGSYAGVAVMGLLSALIVGPCVAPPLIGVLAVIAASGDVWLGGWALFVLSLGMGAPLLLIGASAGKLLPRAGHWMDRVKAVFGVLLLGVAIWMLERILPEAVAMLLWALLLIVSAIYMGAVRPLDSTDAGWQPLVKGMGMVLMIYGVLLLVGVAAGGKDPLQPLRGVGLMAGGGAVAEPLEFVPIKTVADLETQVSQARATGRPAVLDFYADWCVSCKELEKYTFTDSGVQAAWKGALLLRADVTANDQADQALLKRFGIIGPPAVLFFGSDGVERPAYRVVGYMPAEPFREHLEQVMRL